MPLAAALRPSISSGVRGHAVVTNVKKMDGGRSCVKGCEDDVGADTASAGIMTLARYAGCNWLRGLPRSQGNSIVTCWLEIPTPGHVSGRG
jgi:hypothetical protein